MTEGSFHSLGPCLSLIIKKGPYHRPCTVQCLMPLKCGPADRLRPEAICVYVWHPMNAATDNNTIYEAVHMTGLWCWHSWLMKCARSHLKAKSFHITSKKLLLREGCVHVCFIERHSRPEVTGCLHSFRPRSGIGQCFIIKRYDGCIISMELNKPRVLCKIKKHQSCRTESCLFQ